nr:hypothetical protein [Pirellula staleyi]
MSEALGRAASGPVHPFAGRQPTRDSPKGGVAMVVVGEFRHI